MKTIWIIVSVVTGTIVLAGIGVLIWFLVRSPEQRGFGDIAQHSAFTRIDGAGDMFWWFYPTAADVSPESRPLILWLDGVTDLPPSLSANIGMFGPFDHDLNRREDSWVEDYNLLFIDAPLGTGFSTVTNTSAIPTNVEQTAEHLLLTLSSFYSIHGEHSESPLYVFGQGHGAQLALALAKRLQENDAAHIGQNLKGLALGNGVIDPALVMTKLGFYLEELAYIGNNGRAVLETLASQTQELVSNGNQEAAFVNFMALKDIVETAAGAIAVNLRHIVEKQTRSSTRDIFGQEAHLRSILQANEDLIGFMEDTVAPALGIHGSYDAGRDDVLRAFAGSYMRPAASMVEYILQNTDIRITIYNGNLDAVSNTPGQLEWVNNLQWDGQEGFLSSTRNPLVLNRQLEGYFRETDRLSFYWMNAAGQPVPLDSPLAMRRVLRSVAGY